MAGKHRGSSHRGKTSHLSRLTLDPMIEKTVQHMAAAEQRSLGNMLSVLVTEAVDERLRRKSLKSRIDINN